MSDLSDEERNALIREKEKRIKELEERKILEIKTYVTGSIPTGRGTSTKSYTNKNLNIDILAIEIEDWFKKNGYTTQLDKSEDGIWLVQATKGSWIRTIVASKRSFNVLIKGSPDNFTVSTGIGSWVNNLATLGVLTVISGGVILLFAGGATLWSKKIQNDVENFIEQRIIFGKKVGDKPPEVISTRSHSDMEKRILEYKKGLDTKIKSLDQALASGVLDDDEYKKKKSDFESDVEIKIKLEYLNDSKDKGVLTDSEFEDKKSKLLGN